MKFLKTYQLFEKELSEIEKSITDLQNREVTAETADTFKNDIKKLTQDLIDSNLSEIESNRLADLIYQLNDKIPEGSRFFVKKESRDDKTRLESRFVDVGKIKGVDIDNDDFRRYINCLISLIENKFDLLATSKKDFEYTSPDDASTIISASRHKFLGSGYWMFKYKETNFEKIKFKIGLDSFKPEFKDDIIKDLQNMIDVTTPEGVSLAETIADMDAQNETAPDFGPIPEIQPDTMPKPEKDANEVTEKADKGGNVVITKDDMFVKDTIRLMVEEKLTEGFVDTDEDKIYQWFLSEENKLKTMNKANIDAILIGYKAEMSKPLREGLLDDTINSIKRASQSVVDVKSAGLIKDLLNAFNTDTARVNSDIDSILKSFTTFCQNDINSYVTKNEDFTVETGLLGAGLVVGAYKTRGLIKGTYGFVSKMFGNGVGVGKMPTKSLLVAAALMAAYGGYDLYKSINSQQKQIAMILINMYASGSTIFLEECRKAGIKFNNYVVNTTKLQEFVTPVSESHKIVDISKLFKFFSKRKVDNKIAVSLISQHLGINKILFIVDKPMSEDSRDIVNFYICYENKYYSVDGEFDKAELCEKEKLTKSTFNDKTFFGNSFKTKVILKDLKLKPSEYIMKEYEQIIKNEK